MYYSWIWCFLSLNMSRVSLKPSGLGALMYVCTHCKSCMKLYLLCSVSNTGISTVYIPVEEWECWTILVRAPGLGNYSMSSSGSCIRPWLIPGTPSSRQKIDFLRSRDPETKLPVLLITAWRLTQFLEESLPYHTQFCHIMSLALAYLYSKNIIHCDLFSNNELFIANRIAKNSPMPSHDSTHNVSGHCSTHEPALRH